MTASPGAGTRQFAAFLEDMPNAIIGVDRNNAIMLVNARAVSLFGYQRREMIGKSIELLLQGYSSNTLTHLKIARRNDSRVRRTVALMKLAARRKDGSTFPADVLATST